ncbi:hypothetical protein B0J11DRAFT_71625 [Dendryphion nanum]|uniref:ABM domain-containing protein n=1 Tax=Dendryphion nanum TaxID=256645 RepID=A0A9P9DFZ0_9PLEO|nr:hypothetical protein B0J11DRAFT_71625 [Dendryphion nanum]
MSSLVVIAQIPTAGGEAKKTVFNLLSKISEAVKANEPDAYRYAITEPRQGDDKAIWMVEEFKDQAAYDSHLASEPIVNLYKFIGENPALISGTPNIIIAEASSAFTRPEVTNSTDPFIVFAAINYKEGKRAEALEGWKTVTSETKKNEPETLSYYILKDRANELTVNTLEIYASEDYFRKVHMPSEAVKANKEKYGDEFRTGLSFQQLKFIGGFLHK